jgi:hypothetical protein
MTNLQKGDADHRSDLCVVTCYAQNTVGDDKEVRERYGSGYLNIFSKLNSEHSVEILTLSAPLTHIMWMIQYPLFSTLPPTAVRMIMNDCLGIHLSRYIVDDVTRISSSSFSGRHIVLAKS